MKLTIFTPTYNRARLLPRLYDSLCKQGCYDFEWLIVDDGSTDQTKEIVDEFIAERKICIRYYCKENGGKHTAHNMAIRLAVGDWFMCLDSDDMLAPCAMERLEQALAVLSEDDAGLICGKQTSDGHMLSKELPVLDQHCGFYEYTSRYDADGEYALVFRTDVINKYPFPEIYGERFSGESIVYDQMDLNGSVYAVLNMTIQICEYQENGLTRNIYKNLVNNPTGYQIYHMQRIDLVRSLRERVKHAVQYQSFKRMSGNRQYVYLGRHQLLTRMVYVFGILGAQYYKRKQR